MLHALGLIDLSLWHFFEGKKVVLVNDQLNGAKFALAYLNLRVFVLYLFFLDFDG